MYSHLNFYGRSVSHEKVQPKVLNKAREQEQQHGHKKVKTNVLVKNKWDSRKEMTGWD